jgi:hypothetical protein
MVFMLKKEIDLNNSLGIVSFLAITETILLDTLVGIQMPKSNKCQ